MVHVKDECKENEEDAGDAQGNPLHGDGGGAGVSPNGSGKRDNDEMKDNDEDEDVEIDPAESDDKDPVTGQAGKDSIPHTHTMKGKEMAKILISFCFLSKSKANTILVYFSMSKMDKSANFHEEHWKDTFSNGRSDIPAQTAQSMPLFYLHHNKTESSGQHGIDITTVEYSAPQAHSCA